jgi:eukaryotic-like serine/threonine-protein kinase
MHNFINMNSTSPSRTAAGIVLPFLCLFSGLLFFPSCKKMEVASSQKGITSFILEHDDHTGFAANDIRVTISADTINVRVPAATNLSNLIPLIQIKGISISPATGVPQNFYAPVTYTVTAADSSKISYTVIVTAAVEDNLLADIVYMGSSNNNFYALDAHTGSLVWKDSTSGEFQYSTPTIDNGVIFVGCINGYLYAFDDLTGATKWSYLTGSGIEAGTAVYNGTVYTGSDDHTFYAVDEQSGHLKWKYVTGGNVSSTPVVAGGIVYFGSSDNNVYALDAVTGVQKWSFATQAMVNASAPVLANGTLFIGSRDSYLYALDMATGNMKWKFGTGGISLEQSSPTISNGIVYIASWVGGSVYAVDANTGLLVWQALNGLGFSSSPVIADGRLYISADDGNLYALDATTGGLLWNQLIYANSATPAVANGIVYIGGGGTWNIYAFNAGNGAPVWQFPVPGGLMTGRPVFLLTAGANRPG